MNYADPQTIKQLASDGLAELASGEPHGWAGELMAELEGEAGEWSALVAALALRNVADQGSAEAMPERARQIVTDAVRQAGRRGAAQ